MTGLTTGARERGSKGLGESLRSKLAAVGRKLVRVEVIRRLAIAASVAVAGLALLLAVDWLADLSLEARTVVLTGLGTLVALLVLGAMAALVTQRRDEESLALMVEHEQPGFRSRLIASVPVTRGKASIPDEGGQVMVERLLEDTETYAKPLALTEVVKTGPLKRALLAALLLGGIAVGGYVAGGGITQDLLKRAFLSDVPVPRATRVAWVSGVAKIGIGDPVTLEAQASGHQPDSGTLRIRYESGRRQKVTMEPLDGKPGRFGATLENVQESFTCVATLHDGRSERRTVRALPRPAVVELTGRQTYPDYTKLPPSEHRPGEFLLFPGSRLDLTITASQPLRRGTVRTLGSSGTVTSRVDEGNPRLLHASFTAPDKALTGFTVELLDAEDMASQDATVYRVDLLSAEAPKVWIVRPSRQRELVTARARVLVAYAAEDRFGVERLALHYKVADSEARSLDLPIAEQGARKVEEEFDWALEDLDPGVMAGDEIEFWIEAHDRNADTAAGKSGIRHLRVVTPREKREDLLSRVGDSLGRIDQATDDQERLNAVLAEWIRAQAPRPSVPTTPKNNQNGNE